MSYPEDRGSSPQVLVDFASTLHKFHEDRVHFRAFPKAAYLHPSTLLTVLRTTPEYAIKNRDGVWFVFGVELKEDAALEKDVVHFVCPSYMLLKMVGANLPSVLYSKPEYMGTEHDGRYDE